MAGKRNNSIELLRDLLMLGICVLHSNSPLGGYRTGWVSNLLCPCVPCFIFISGLPWGLTLGEFLKEVFYG